MEITCYPTYGFKKDGAWKIPVRVWVHTNRSLFASFHYVSGGPWQLYNPLAEFLIKKEGFPAGSFHMRTVNKTLSAANFLNDLKLLVEDGFSPSAVSREATRQH